MSLESVLSWGAMSCLSSAMSSSRATIVAAFIYSQPPCITCVVPTGRSLHIYARYALAATNMAPKTRKRKSDSKKYEQEYETCSCEELRQKLVELGENPGPIDASNKYATELETFTHLQIHHPGPCM